MEYQEYKELVERYNSKDNREVNFQNRIIIPFLDSIFNFDDKISCVDISQIYKNRNKTKNYDRLSYAGDSTPDILVVDNWDIVNGNDDRKYHFVVEVKQPFAKDYAHLELELKNYLKTKVKSIIVTNCLRWTFYKSTIEPLEEIVLSDKYSNKENSQEWAWYPESEFDKLKKFIKKFYRDNEYYMHGKHR